MRVGVVTATALPYSAHLLLLQDYATSSSSHETEGTREQGGNKRQRLGPSAVQLLHMCVCVCCGGVGIATAFPHAAYLLLVQAQVANSSSIETIVKREPAGHNINDASEVCGCAGRRCDGDRIAIFCTPSSAAG